MGVASIEWNAQVCKKNERLLPGKQESGGNTRKGGYRFLRGIGLQCAAISFLATTPPFITKRTRSSSDTSASGLPDTATISAK